MCPEYLTPTFQLRKSPWLRRSTHMHPALPTQPPRAPFGIELLSLLLCLLVTEPSVHSCSASLSALSDQACFKSSHRACAIWKKMPTPRPFVTARSTSGHCCPQSPSLLSLFLPLSIPCWAQQGHEKNQVAASSITESICIRTTEFETIFANSLGW